MVYHQSILLCAERQSGGDWRNPCLEFVTVFSWGLLGKLICFDCNPCPLDLLDKVFTHVHTHLYVHKHIYTHACIHTDTSTWTVCLQRYWNLAEVLCYSVIDATQSPIPFSIEIKSGSQKVILFQTNSFNNQMNWNWKKVEYRVYQFQNKTVLELFFKLGVTLNHLSKIP